MKKRFSLVLVLLLFSAYFEKVQAEYPAAPQYWKELLQAFYQTPKTVWQPKYIDRDARNKRVTSLRFSTYFETKKSNAAQKVLDTTAYEKSALVELHQKSGTDSDIASFHPKNSDWEFEKIEISLHSKKISEFKSNIFVQGFGAKSAFDQFGKAVLWPKNSHSVLDQVISVQNHSNMDMPEVIVKIDEVWLRHKTEGVVVPAVLIGNTRSVLKSFPSLLEKKFLQAQSGQNKIKDTVVTPSEVRDILSFTYVPNYETEVLNSVKIFESFKNSQAASVIKKLELYDAETKQVLATVVPESSEVLFAFDTPYLVNKTRPNQFKVRAYFRDAFPDFSYSNEVRWTVNPADFALVYKSTGYPVPISNKPLKIQNATLFLKDSRVQVVADTEKNTFSFKNIGVKNSYIARTAFVLPDFDRDNPESVRLQFFSEQNPNYLLKFSGNVLRVDFQDPVKILPNQEFRFMVVRDTGKKVNFINAEREKMLDTIYNLKQKNAYHIWVGSTNWYNRYQPVWMNGDYFEILPTNKLEKN